MLDYTKEELLELGQRSPLGFTNKQMFGRLLEAYQARRDEIAAFLKGADKHDYIKVILTGAGTSAYVGDTLVPAFKVY